MTPYDIVAQHFRGKDILMITGIFNASCIYLYNVSNLQRSSPIRNFDFALAFILILLMADASGIVFHE